MVASLLSFASLHARRENAGKRVRVAKVQRSQPKRDCFFSNGMVKIGTLPSKSSKLLKKIGTFGRGCNSRVGCDHCNGTKTHAPASLPLPRAWLRLITVDYGYLQPVGDGDDGALLEARACKRAVQPRKTGSHAVFVRIASCSPHVPREAPHASRVTRRPPAAW